MSQNVEKSGLKLYFVDHEYSVVESNEIFDIIKHIGVFSSKNEAEKAVAHMKKHTKLGRKYPENFEISEIITDCFLYWSEGFNSYDD